MCETDDASLDTKYEGCHLTKSVRIQKVACSICVLSVMLQALKLEQVDACETHMQLARAPSWVLAQQVTAQATSRSMVTCSPMRTPAFPTQVCSERVGFFCVSVEGYIM